MRRQTLRKLMVLTTVASGVAAAYLMYRRGASLFTIAAKTLTNPVGALASELEKTVQTDTPANALNVV